MIEMTDRQAYKLWEMEKHAGNHLGRQVGSEVGRQAENQRQEPGHNVLSKASQKGKNY